MLILSIFDKITLDFSAKRLETMLQFEHFIPFHPNFLIVGGNFSAVAHYIFPLFVVTAFLNFYNFCHIFCAQL